MSHEVKIYEHIDGLDTYFEEVKKYKKRLTHEEEIELAYKIRDGNEEALDKLVKHNLRFVITIAKRYRSKTDVSFADLISEGNIGLIKAAKHYDPTRKVKFSSCAIWWIKASINECIERYKGNIEYNVVDDYQIVNLAEKDALYDNINEEFEKKMNNLQSRQSAIDDLIKCLEEREMKIIMMFFGLGETAREMNLEEISQEMCLTKERVRQIKESALVKMKCEAICSDEFETYRDLR
jgi:RNA polymerase primary sigma factor